MIFNLSEFLTIKELTVIIIFLGFIELLFIYLLNKDLLLFFSYPCILLVLICLFTFNFKSNNIISFASSINEISNDYILVALMKNKDSLFEIDNPKIGYVKSLVTFDNIKADYEPNCYSSFNDMIKDLNLQKIDAMIIQDSQFQNLNHDKYSKISELKIEEEVIPVINNNTNTSLIYLTSTNDIENISTNIILGINNKTRQITIIGIPSNYYVDFKGEKETLANINKYGLNESIKVIEELIEDRINYYVNFDFNYSDKLIEKIGDLEIELDQEFVSFGYEFKKGTNIIRKDELIPLMRYNNPLMGGNRLQSENQIKVVEAIINKLLDDNKYLEVLNELEQMITTNIPKDILVKFIKNQLTYNYEWNIAKYSLDGEDKFEYTHLSKCCKISVIEPEVMTINTAITMIEYLKSNSIFN